MNQLVTINLHNETLEFIKGDKSEYWIVIKRICENLKIEYSRQLKRIKSDKRLTVVHMYYGSKDGKERAMSCLSYEDFWCWLSSINPKKVKTSTAEILYKYHHLLKKSLEYWFHDKTEINND